MKLNHLTSQPLFQQHRHNNPARFMLNIFLGNKHSKQCIVYKKNYHEKLEIQLDCEFNNTYASVINKLWNIWALGATYPMQFHLEHSDWADCIAKDFLIKSNKEEVAPAVMQQVLRKG